MIVLELKGTPIRRMDTIIAAITINNNAKLYSFDVKHFKPLEEYELKFFYNKMFIQKGEKQ